MTEAKRYLILDVGCAECRHDSDGSLVKVLGYADTPRRAREIADSAGTHHNWLGPWDECPSGWFARAGDGELRIIDTLRRRRVTMTEWEIPNAWTEEAVDASKARFEVDGTWYHYTAVVTIVRKAIAAELRRLANGPWTLAELAARNVEGGLMRSRRCHD